MSTVVPPTDHGAPGYSAYGAGDHTGYTNGNQAGYGNAYRDNYGMDHNGAYGADNSRFREVANPAPLGWFALATTTFVWSLTVIGNRGVNEPNIVIGLALFYGGLVQILAGMWAFARGHTFDATVFSSYGAFWLSYATLNIPAFAATAGYSDDSDLEDAFGFYYMGWFIVTFLIFMSTWRFSVSHTVLFAFWTLSFLLLGIGTLRRSSRCSTAAGYFGIFTAFAAWYVGIAILMTKRNSYFTIPLISLGRKGTSRGTVGNDRTTKASHV